MNIEDFRNYCLGLGDDVTEKTPFGKFSKRFESTLVFYVKGHMFCLCDMDDFTFVELKASADEALQLVEAHEAVTRTINPVLKGWIHINLNSDISVRELLKLVAEAYHIIKSEH